MRLRLCSFIMVVPGLVYAQTERGNITGMVSDPTSAVIAGATVTATNRATNTTATAVSTAAGEYNLPNLAPGEYRVEVSAPGFKRYLRERVTLTAAGTVRIDAQLEVGQVSESIEVSAAVSQIQSENAKISTAVQNRLVDELPLVVGGNLRSPFDLVAVTPESRGSGSGLSFGGGQAGAWDATLDGLSVTTSRSGNTLETAYNSPSVDAITEFTVDTNGFKAEYGQAGGGVMTFVSKSGSNQVHGTAYDFLRNDKLDARGFFAPKRSVYKQNDFGVTFSGPVYIPKLYNGRNKTFFFLSYEGFRNRVGANDMILSVPTPEMYQGDFSNWVDKNNKRIQIYDPATTRANPSGAGFIRDPFANNQIPQDRFSAFSKVVMSYAMPVKPNRGATPGAYGYVQNNFISTGGTLLNPSDKGSVRVDHSIGDRHRLAFFMNKASNRIEAGPAGPPGLPDPLADVQVIQYDNSVYRLSYDLTINPRLLNHFAIGGNNFFKNGYSPATGRNWKDKVCFKGVVDCNVNFPVVSFSEFSTWNSAAYNGTEQPNWSIKEDLSYIRGKHSFKFGYAFEEQRGNGFGQQNIAGAAGFSFQGTSVPAATSPTSGSSFASFLLGNASSGNTETVRYVSQVYRYHGFYVQDDWRLTRRLTMNLGLRYEFTLPPFSLNDVFSDFTPDRPNPDVNNYPGALRFAGFGPGRENTRSLVPGWYGAIGPRLGLAFTLNPKTTIRGGFARSFSKVSVINGSAHYAGFIGQYSFTSPDQGVTPAFNWDTGLPPYPLPPQINPSFQNNQNVDYWQPYDAVRAPENFNWTLSVQRQVTPNMVLEAAYNATVGTHLQTGLVNLNQTPTRYLNDFIQRYGPADALALLRADINSAVARAAGIPIPYANFTNPGIQRVRTVVQALRPYPQYLNIGGGDKGADRSGHSAYHSLVLKAERRFSSGLTFQWNYTLSKILTDSDTYFTAGFAMDQYNRGLEKSIGQFDQTHSVKLSTIYELPLGRGRKWVQHGIASHLVGGWRISAIQTYASGFPIAVARNNPLPPGFSGPNRPVVSGYDNWRAPVAGAKFDPAVDRFMNRAAFPAQPNYVFGNATRYNPKLRAWPGYNENISLAKSLSFSESKRLDFRWEAFNLWNRTTFGTGSTNLDSNSFGLVLNQVNTPRQMQVALKLYW